MKVIEKKCWPAYFQAIADGTKTFDIRLANFVPRVGDVLWLREWDPATEDYTGRELRRRITYLVETRDLRFWTEKAKADFGFHVMGLARDEAPWLTCGNCRKWSFIAHNTGSCGEPPMVRLRDETCDEHEAI